MARSVNVDPLRFRNISLGTDLIQIKYDNYKTKKSGEKLSTKNTYANPLDYTQCFYLGLGIYCCIYSNKLPTSEKFFLKPGNKRKVCYYEISRTACWSA